MTWLPAGSVPDDADPADVVRQRCRDFSVSHPEVPMYARIADAASADDDAIELLRCAAPGQARPVLLLAALHDLVMRRPETPAARWFPDGPEQVVPQGDPWPDVRLTLSSHADELRSVIATRATQTNEVNRAGYVIAMVAAACADLPNTPVTLLELGASAGLLLNLDRYRVSVGKDTIGPADSPVHATTAVRGAQPSLALPPLASRAGIDLFPIGPDDTDDLRWLRACLWPEMPDRLGRFDAAVRVLRDHPPVLIGGDMVEVLPAAIDQVRAADSHLVAYSSWAITYLARHRRPALLGALSAAATDGPVSLVTAEPPGCVPGLPTPATEVPDRLTGTDVGMQRWRGGQSAQAQLIGRVHPHGAWLQWQ
ncbi:DUF2332 domain-containing protein [Calidifontibacter terrae]